MDSPKKRNKHKKKKNKSQTNFGQNEERKHGENENQQEVSESQRNDESPEQTLSNITTPRKEPEAIGSTFHNNETYQLEKEFTLPSNFLGYEDQEDHEKVENEPDYLKQIKFLKLTIEQLSHEKNKLTQEGEEKDKKIQKLTMELEHTLELLDKGSPEKNASSQEISRLSEENTALKEQLEESRRNLENLKADYSAKLNRINDALNQRKGDVAELKEVVQKIFSSTYEKYEREIGDLIAGEEAARRKRYQDGLNAIQEEVKAILTSFQESFQLKSVETLTSSENGLSSLSAKIDECNQKIRKIQDGEQRHKQIVYSMISLQKRRLNEEHGNEENFEGLSLGELLKLALDVLSKEKEEVQREEAPREELPKEDVSNVEAPREEAQKVEGNQEEAGNEEHKEEAPKEVPHEEEEVKQNQTHDARDEDGSPSRGGSEEDVFHVDDELRKELGNLNEKYETLKKVLTKLIMIVSSKINSLDKETADQILELTQNFVDRKSIEDLSLKIEETRGYQARIVDLESQIKRKDETIGELKSTLTKSMEEQQNLQSRLESSEISTREILEEILQIAEGLASREMAYSQESPHVLKDKILRSLESASKHRDQMHESNKTLRTEADTLRRETETLRRGADTLRGDREQFLLEINELRQENSRMSERLMDQDALIKNICHYLNQSLRTSTVYDPNLQGIIDNDDINAKLEQISLRMMDRHTCIVSFRSLESKIDEIRDAIFNNLHERLDAQIMPLQRLQESVDWLSSKSSISRQEKEKLLEELFTKDRQVASLENKLRKKEEETNLRHLDVAEWSNELSQLFAKYRERIEKLSDTIFNFEEEMIKDVTPKKTEETVEDFKKLIEIHDKSAQMIQTVIEEAKIGSEILEKKIDEIKNSKRRTNGRDPLKEFNSAQIRVKKEERKGDKQQKPLKKQEKGAVVIYQELLSTFVQSIDECFKEVMGNMKKIEDSIAPNQPVEPNMFHNHQVAIGEIIAFCSDCLQEFNELCFNYFVNLTLIAPLKGIKYDEEKLDKLKGKRDASSESSLNQLDNNFHQAKKIIDHLLVAFNKLVRDRQ